MSDNGRPLDPSTVPDATAVSGAPNVQDVPDSPHNAAPNAVPNASTNASANKGRLWHAPWRGQVIGPTGIDRPRLHVMPRRPAGVVLLVSLALAMVAGHWQQHANRTHAEASFKQLTATAVERLTRRMDIYMIGLRGADAMLGSVGVDHINRDQFKRYVELRRIETEFPEALGMGFARRVGAAGVPAFVDRVRRDGAPNFAVRSRPGAPPVVGDHAIIQFIEPLPNNVARLGLDMATVPTLADAAQRAMRTGEAAMSAPYDLTLGDGSAAQATLMLVPVYRQGAVLDTPEQREQALVGWSGASLWVGALVQHVGQAEPQFTMVVNDVTGVTEAQAATVTQSLPIYASPQAAPPREDGVQQVVQVPLYGRMWSVRFDSTPLFEKNLKLTDPRLVAGVVAMMGVLIALMTYLGLKSRERERQVRAETARRAAVVEASSDAIIGEDLDGRITDWNRSAELMFGYTAAQALGQPLAKLLLPPDRGHEDYNIRLIVSTGVAVPPFDSARLRANGELVEVSIAAYPIVAADGSCRGLCKSVRDISQARRAERMARHAESLAVELNAGLEAQVAERTAMLETARHRLQTILDAMPSQIGYWDCGLINQMANQAHQDWFCVDPARLPGTHMRDIFGTELFERSLPRLEAALAGQPQRFVECMVQLGTENGQRHALVNYMPDVIDGQVRGLFTLVHDVTEMTEARNKLDAAMRENEVLLRTIQTHAIVSVTDDQGRITEVNDLFCQISGYSREELVGQDHRLINSGTHAKSERARMWQQISSGQMWRGELCNRAKDGSLYWVDNMIAPFMDAQGRVNKYISICNDITARKRSEADLRQSNHRFALASEAAGMGFWDIDLKAQTLQWDEGMYRVYGRERDDSNTPKGLWGISLHPQDLHRSTARLMRCIENGEDYSDEFRIFHPDGQVRHLKSAARVQCDETGRAVWMYGVDFDITERKSSELALKATSSLLQTVLDSATEVAVIAVSPAGDVTVFNSGAQRMLGYAPGEVLGQGQLHQFFDADEMVIRAQDMSHQLGREISPQVVWLEPEMLGQTSDWTCVRKDGSPVSVNMSVTAMSGGDGHLFGYLAVATDVTRQKQVEQKLREAMHKAKKANQAKSLFLANMSHEIRTPMNAVMGLSYLLGQTTLDAEQAGFLAKIRSASKSLLAVINDVLDLSKIEAGELKIDATPFSLRTLLGDLAGLVSIQAQDKDIGFEVEVSDDLPMALVGDAVRLNQVLINLLNNAVKFTDHGGVHLQVRALESSADAVVLRFSVKDSGIGIPPEVQEKLFAPFVQADTSTTRRFGGTGLGLSIVKHLVSLMGGQVTVDSRAAVGSEFIVELGFGVASPEALGALLVESGAPDLNGLQGVRVLVVDDSEINLEVAKRILQRQGAQVSLACNGQEAVECLRKEPAAFDVVLMDVQMPVMDGYEATLYIRQQLALATLPIIALTAGALTSEQQRASAAGMDDFVSKPFDVNSLVRCIRRYVQVKPGAAGRAAAQAPEPPPVAWPQIDGIDGVDAAKRLGGDLQLFHAMLKRLLEEFSDLNPAMATEAMPDKAARDLLAGRLHKLKGCAGLLGARDLHQISANAEVACRINDTSRVESLLQSVAQQVARLAASANPEMQQRKVTEDAQLEADSHVASPLDPARLHALTILLRQQNLSALEQFNAIAPQLRRRVDRDTFSRMREQIDCLRFTEVADVLERL